MVKRFLATKGWILISVTIMSSAIIIVMYDRLKAAEKNLVDYRLAISCPSKDNCREKFEAEILEAHHNRFFILLLDRHGNTSSLRNVNYVFSISSPNGKQTVEIPANPPSIETAFDIGNVHIPPDSGANFIQENFRHGETVFIETWRNQITFLFTDSIIDIPDIVILPTPTVGSAINQTSLSPLPKKTYEIAMPTSIHPILLQANAQYDLFSTTLLCLLITGVTFGLVLRKDN